MLGRISEILVMRYLRVGIHFERIDSAILGQAVINPRVSVQAENSIDALRQPLELFFPPVRGEPV